MQKQLSHYQSTVFQNRTFTFLISEDITGLQVMKRNGDWVNLTKAEEPNYILVNMGELMNRWSDDELTAANHRVVYKDVYGVQGSGEQPAILNTVGSAFFSSKYVLRDAKGIVRATSRLFG